MEFAGVALALLLTGTVVAPDGGAIPGAAVIVIDRAAASVATDAAGVFTLDNVDLPLTLAVSAPGFATARVRVTSTPVTITLLPRAVDVSVVVAGETGRPGVTSLTRETLTMLPAVTTDERLRSVAGFSLFRRSSSRAANPTTHGVTMRGLSASGASRGLVLLDGVPLNDGFGGWVTWTRVPPGALDRVDVIAGAAGDLFGSDALGGVIRLRSPEQVRRDGTVAVEGGSYATYAVDVSGGGRRAGLSFFGALSGFDSAGGVPLETASVGPVDRQADATWWNGFGRLDVALPRGRWTLYGFGGRDDRGNGTELQRNRMSGGTVATSLTLASAATTAAARVSVSPNAFDQTFTAVSAGRVSETLTSTQRIESTTTRAALEAGRSSARAYGLVQGTLTRARADFLETRPTGTTAVALRDDGESLSAQAAWTGWAGATISGGVRQEWRAAPGEGDGREQARVGRLAAEWRASGVVTLRGSAATSHRWPTLNELARGFRVGAAVTNPNPDLRPERSRAVEGGVRLQQSAWAAGATVFRSVVHDAIVNVTVSGLVRQRRNAGDAVAAGVEFDADWRMAPGLRLRGSIQVVDATFRGTVEPILDGKRLPQVPTVSGAAIVDLSWARATMSAVLRSTGSQFDDDRNVFRLAGATQVDVRAQVTQGRGALFVVAENVFDARVETGRTPLVTLAPGRAARVGVRVLLGDLRR